MKVPFSLPETVTRFNTGTRDDKGRYTEGAETNPVINMSIQPLISISAGDQIILDRLGIRSVDGLIRMYSEGELFTESKANVSTADRVTWNGQVYEVKSVQRWPNPQPHYRCIGALADEKTL